MYNLSLHLDIPSRLRAKQPLCSFFNALSLGNMANYFVRSDRESNQRPNALELSTLTITTELRSSTSVNKHISIEILSHKDTLSFLCSLGILFVYRNMQ